MIGLAKECLRRQADTSELSAAAFYSCGEDVDGQAASSSAGPSAVKPVKAEDAPSDLQEAPLERAATKSEQAEQAASDLKEVEEIIAQERAEWHFEAERAGREARIWSMANSIWDLVLERQT